VARAQQKLAERPPPAVATSFKHQVRERLGEADQQALRKVRWIDLLTSLWTPITVLGLVFVVYLFIVELHTPNSLWAQPAMKWFGVVMLGWFAGVGVARLIVRPFSKARKLRYESRDLIHEIDVLLERRPGAVDAKVREELATSAVALFAAMATDNLGLLEDRARALAGLADKHLAKWRKASVFDHGMGFVKALAVALAIRAVLIEPFKIPSGSMIPTLEIGDQIFVNKFLYGVRLPFINVVPFVLVREPKRGDVIVFNNPVDPSKDYIKRVVGLPGDRVRLVNGVVHLDGLPQPRRLVDAQYAYWDERGGEWAEAEGMLFLEELGGARHPLLEIQGHTRGDNTPEWTVPARHVFVLGDNRDNSLDSRYRLGAGSSDALAPEFVPYGHIKGKAMVIWLSLSHGGLLSQYFGGTGIRNDRFFQPVR
jgi:signal peptidase I